MSRYLKLAALVVWVGAACGRETPLGVGAGLVPVAVETFEVVLAAERFLAQTSDFSGYSQPAQSPFWVVAAGYGGTLTANTLARFARPPNVISYPDAQGTPRLDTLPTFPGARLVLRVDTLRSRSSGPVELSLYRTAQEWDPRTATWTLGVDSAGRRLSWNQPGGTRGALVGQAIWQPGSDSVVIAVDSQTVALWADTLDVSRGAAIVAGSAGSRLRLTQVVMRLNARPSPRPDTLVTVTAGLLGLTFVFDPPPPAQASLQLGGVPAWRSFLRFTERLDTVTVCGGSPSRCHRLGETTINLAALMLRPSQVPAAFLPEDTVRVEARALFRSDDVPLERSPLAERLLPSGRPSIALAPERFQQGNGGGAFELPITGYMSALTRKPASDSRTVRNHVALLSAPEGATFGFGAFAMAGQDAPRLRLIVSVALPEEGAP